MTPALLLVGVFLVWPLLYTAVLSFRDADGRGWAGLTNYRYLATSSEVRSALGNNVVWIASLVVGCSLLGLVVAVLADKVRYETVVKGLTVAPVAISFVCGAVIWRFMFDYQPPGVPQVGTLSAVYTTLTAAPPVAWLVEESTNDAALVMVGVWMATGFAVVILSAAVKAVPVWRTLNGHLRTLPQVAFRTQVRVYGQVVTEADAMGTSWVPGSCALPTAQQPLRVAEFDDLFATDVTGLERDDGGLQLQLRPDAAVASRAMGLAVRETQCCSLFTFVVTATGSELTMRITASPQHAAVLDAIAARASQLRS